MRNLKTFKCQFLPSTTFLGAPSLRLLTIYHYQCCHRVLQFPRFFLLMRSFQEFPFHDAWHGFGLGRKEVAGCMYTFIFNSAYLCFILVKTCISDIQRSSQEVDRAKCPWTDVPNWLGHQLNWQEPLERSLLSLPGLPHPFLTQSPYAAIREQIRN